MFHVKHLHILSYKRVRGERKKMTRNQLEKTYGIKITDDSFYNPRNGRFVKAYKFCSADGCSWENGLRTIKAIEQECQEWAKHLLSIKERVERGVLI